jgi:hypothetical protein
MIDVLIFSRDRPAQLELLLRSIREHAPNLYSTVSVLMRRPSRKMFWIGYTSFEWGDTRLIPENYFEGQVREWLDQAGPLVSFLVDDDVFYRDAPKPTPIACSYRGGDYDYPFSLDGNVYQRDHIVTLLEGLPFRNPTELEWFGHEHRSRLPFRLVNPRLPPCLVGLPYNRVAEVGGMPSMGIDPAEMNRRFLAGERLQIPTVADGESLGVHAMLEPEWEAE